MCCFGLHNHYVLHRVDYISIMFCIWLPDNFDFLIVRKVHKDNFGELLSLQSLLYKEHIKEKLACYEFFCPIAWPTARMDARFN